MSAFEIFIEEKIFSFLLLLKINPSLKGYDYIKAGVRLLIKDSSKKINMYKRLYREIGNIYNEKEEIVDRAVRHSIKVGVGKEGVIDFEKITNRHFSSLYPSPREIICMLAEVVRIEWVKMGANEERYVKNWIDVV